MLRPRGRPCVLILLLVSLVSSAFDDLWFEEPEGGWVWRFDTRTPKQIEYDGGFSPKSLTYGQPPDKSLLAHVLGNHITKQSQDRDSFVSAAISQEVAENLAQVAVGRECYIYKIHVSPKFINVWNSLRRHYKLPGEREFASLGKIPWRQVKAIYLFNGYSSKKIDDNRAYDNDYNSQKSGGPAFNLAGFDTSSKTWDEEPWRRYGPFAECRGPPLEANGGAPPVVDRMTLHFALDSGLLGFGNKPEDDLYVSFHRRDSPRGAIPLEKDRAHHIPLLKKDQATGISLDIDLHQAFGTMPVPLKDITFIELILDHLKSESNKLSIRGLSIDVHSPRDKKIYRYGAYSSSTAWSPIKPVQPYEKVLESLWNTYIYPENWRACDQFVHI